MMHNVKKILKLPVIVLFVLMLTIIYGIWRDHQPINIKQSRHQPLIIGHQGQDYTLANYNVALKSGVQYIDQKVFLSQDHHLVVANDNNLNQATGQNINITDSNYRTIQHHKYHNGESVHTLNQIFDKYGVMTNYVIAIQEQNNHHELLERGIISSIKRNHLTNHVLLQSTDVNSLSYMHQSLPQAPEILQIKNTNQSKVDWQKTVSQLPAAVQFIALDQSLVNRETVSFLNKHHKMLMVNDSNSKSDFVHAKSIGAQAIVTDNTKAAKIYFK